MSIQNDNQDAKGRSYEQITKDGSGSAASMGSGGTGDVGRMSGETAAGNAQSDTRTDDLMAPDGAREQGKGFRPSDPEALKTGMEGIAGANRAGNRQ